MYLDQTATPAGVMIINDSPVARAVTAAVVQAGGGFAVIGQATCGLDGVEMVRRLRPDLVLLDMHMPDINGVETTRRIMTVRPTRILICSATIRRNTAYLFDALKQGALDYAHTPILEARPGASVTRQALLAAGDGLLRKMRTVLSLRPSGSPTDPAQPRPGTVRAPAAGADHRPTRAGVRIVAVGSSTGGPTALATLFRNLPRGLDAVFLISQHIDRDFSEGLAQWLAQESSHPVRVGRHGETPSPGHVYLANGGRSNLILSPGGQIQYEAAGEAVYAPNINRLFSTVATHAGARACAVVLTGLGDDGTDGLAQIKASGGKPLVQDPATAVVDGMPGTPIRRGIVSHGQPLPELARLITHWVEEGR